ncbi:hypothetical protein PINS_up011050 [Pythium insidiosum]|nr:hypothetical protein PINS_up011050 [Pythium insidiosum]
MRRSGRSVVTSRRRLLVLLLLLQVERWLDGWMDVSKWSQFPSGRVCGGRDGDSGDAARRAGRMAMRLLDPRRKQDASGGERSESSEGTEGSPVTLRWQM